MNLYFFQKPWVYSGHLIVVEGNTCCGKGSFLKVVPSFSARAASDDSSLVISHEPWSDGDVGKFIRAYIEKNMDDLHSIKNAAAGKITDFFTEIHTLDKEGYYQDEDKKVLSEFSQVLQGAYRRIKTLEKLQTEELQALYILDRWFHTKEFILPELNKGHIVLEDRFWLSTLVYGSAFGVPLSKLWAWHVSVLGAYFLIPDVHIYMDVTPERSFDRLKNDGKAKDIHEDKIENIRNTREAYLHAIAFVNEEFEKHSLVRPSQWIVTVDANERHESVFRATLKEISLRIKEGI